MFELGKVGVRRQNTNLFFKCFSVVSLLMQFYYCFQSSLHRTRQKNITVLHGRNKLRIETKPMNFNLCYKVALIFVDFLLFPAGFTLQQMGFTPKNKITIPYFLQCHPFVVFLMTVSKSKHF